MYIKNSEVDKVNRRELAPYEALLKREEKYEDDLIREFDRNIKTILGKPLYDYLEKNNYITPYFLLTFHYSNIDPNDVFSYENGQTISVRDYYKEQVSKFFSKKTEELKEKVQSKEMNERMLDQNAPYAFALASLGLTTFHRKKKMYVRDVQKLAGFGMCYGEIAELATGEGKTISAVLPAYFHALRGKGSHVVTANNYLSKRDFIELSPVYEGLGLTCGYVNSNVEITDPEKLRDDKKRAYR